MQIICCSIMYNCCKVTKNCPRIYESTFPNVHSSNTESEPQLIHYKFFEKKNIKKDIDVRHIIRM